MIEEFSNEINESKVQVKEKISLNFKRPRIKSNSFIHTDEVESIMSKLNSTKKRKSIKPQNKSKRFDLKNIEPPKHSKNLEKNEVHERLIEKAKHSIKIDFHEPSNNYIHWIEEIGKFGLTAIDPFSHKAEKKLIDMIKIELLNSTSQEIDLWERKLNQVEYRIELNKKIQELKSTSCNGKIGLYTSKELWEELQKESHIKGLSLNSLCINKVQNYLSTLSDQPNNITKKLQNDLAESKLNQKGTEKLKWMIRIPQENHAHLLLLSSEYGISIPKLIYASF